MVAVSLKKTTGNKIIGFKAPLALKISNENIDQKADKSIEEAMEIEGTIRELGPVDSAPLIDVVLSQDEKAWKANQYRQNAYWVHEYTESLGMVFCTGWPEMSVSKEQAWDTLQDVAIPIMHELLEAHYPPGKLQT